jgi:hypothetical protein
MNPALNGAATYTTDQLDYVLVIGGQDKNNKPSDKIYMINKKTPGTMDVKVTLKSPRVDPFAIPCHGQLAIFGGTKDPLIEMFDLSTWAPLKGMEAKSASFFLQLECYTQDIQLKNSTWC